MSDTTPVSQGRVATVRPTAPSGFSAHGATHRGQLRMTNEDAFRVEPSIGLVVVADGVSCAKGGGVAARTVVDEVCRFLLDGGGPPPGPEELRSSARARALRAAIQHAHRRVVEESRRTERPQMGTTVAALWCTAGHAIVVHAGDSRVYRAREGRLEQLTQDHTVAAEYLRQAGELPPEIERLYSHVLTRAVAAKLADVKVDVWMEPLAPDDTFILCTDGLTGGVPDAEILRLVTAADATGAVRALIQAANDAGGTDNTTVAVARSRCASGVAWGGPFLERRAGRSQDDAS
jgi:serine/threonine protein phosphatase PrpC